MPYPNCYQTASHQDLPHLIPGLAVIHPSSSFYKLTINFYDACHNDYGSQCTRSMPQEMRECHQGKRRFESVDNCLWDTLFDLHLLDHRPVGKFDLVSEVGLKGVNTLS